MGWIGLIIAAVGALAIVGAVVNAEPLGRLPLDLARLLVLAASIVIWAGICLAILGLSSPAAAAEAVPGAASWPAELASGIGVVVLAIGVVVLGIGVIQRFGLSGPLPLGAALVTVAVVLWIVSAAWASPAAAHEALTGWSYPLSCCSDRDCRQTAEREVLETAEGYRLASTGEVVGYGDRRVKNSPDGLFHVCQQGGNFDSGRVLCLFAPPRSY